jgi:hypothetical protein
MIDETTAAGSYNFLPAQAQDCHTSKATKDIKGAQNAWKGRRPRGERASNPVGARAETACQSVYSFVSQEFARACLISYESQPTEVFQEATEMSGQLSFRPCLPSMLMRYVGIDMRKALLATVTEMGSCWPFRLRFSI